MQDSCKLTHQNLKATTATPNNLPYTIRWVSPRQGWVRGGPCAPVHNALGTRLSLKAVPALQLECRMQMALTDLVLWSFLSPLERRGKREDSNIFILNHSLIMK